MTANPTAGKPVRFRVEAFDVDARIYARSCGNFALFGDEDTSSRCIADCAAPPENAPPPEPERGHLLRHFKHTYAVSGVYRARFHYQSAGDCEFSRYASEGDAFVTVSVD